MAPPSTFDPLVPPTRETVTDNDGNPTCGTDIFQHFLFLEAAKEAMPTANKEFNELVLFGFISSPKGNIVASAEQAIHLASVSQPYQYSWDNPSPRIQRTTTALPTALQSRFNLQPDYIDKIDRSGADTYLAWFSNSKMIAETRKAASGSGRALLAVEEERRKKNCNDFTVASIVEKYVEYYKDQGIPAATGDAFDSWVEDMILWNKNSADDTRVGPSVLANRFSRAARNLGEAIERRVDENLSRSCLSTAEL